MLLRGLAVPRSANTGRFTRRPGVAILPQKPPILI
jgi:hypothetical protein